MRRGSKVVSRSSSNSSPSSPRHSKEEAQGPNKGFTFISTYLGYGVLVLFGHLRDFFGKLCGASRYFNFMSKPPRVRDNFGPYFARAPTKGNWYPINELRP